MEQTKRQKIHYAWFILAGCCILQGASLGLINNCAGVFYSPVCNDLGFEMGRFTLYRMLFTISCALTMPLVPKSFRKTDVRIAISAAAVVCGVCNILMGTFSALWQWYITGIIQGASTAFLSMIPAPILLGNWFHKKTGTAVGISASFSGLMGMIGSSSLGVIIPILGWRTCYALFGIISMGLILPVSLFVLRYRPEDKNMKAYGQEEEEKKPEAGPREPAERQQGLSDFLRQPTFYVALLAYACTTAGSYLNLFLTSCGLASGLPMALAAMLTTFSLLGNMSSKLVLGKVSDTWGVIRTFLAAILIAEAGHLLLFLGIPSGMMAGALMFGITMPLSTVLFPLFCRLFWKGETYGTAFSYATMGGTLLASPFNTLFGRFYDMTGSYRLTISVSAALILVVFGLVILEKRLRKL